MSSQKSRDDVEQRTERALTECMTVLPEGGDIYTVVGENGTTYVVDSRVGRCTCDDHKYREPTGGCKHQRRVEFATGVRAVPVDVERVDDLLGEHTDETPHVVASDGGVIEAVDGRPVNCDCVEFHTDVELSCWACYRKGFETPAVADHQGGDDE